MTASRLELPALARLALTTLALALAGASLSAQAHAQAGAPGASAQASAPEASVRELEARLPDVPAGDATIRGRVVHPAGPERAAGVEVVLYALSSSGTPGLRRGKSDAEGGFEFAGLAADPSVAYLVGGRFEDVPYPGARVRFGSGPLVRDVTVQIADVQRDPAPVRLEELRLRLDFLGGSLQVSETLALRNAGDRTVYAAAGAREGVRPAAEVRLPEGATDFRLPFGVTPEGLVREGDLVRWFGPVYPGDQEVGYAYALPAGDGPVRLTRRIATPAERLVVLAPADGPAPSATGLAASGLTEVEATELDGRPYRRFEGRFEGAGLGRGKSLEIALEVPPASRDTSRVSVAEAKLILDPDAAALRVREEHVIRVAGDERVVASPGAPVLRISLPEGAQDVRFGGDGTGLGAVPDGAGGLALLGPLPPGESTLGLEYLLSDGATKRVFERRFEHPLSLLSIFVADAGALELESDRLHRRRPVRAPDRTYARLEAFEVGAGETVSLTLGTLPPRTGLSRGGMLLVFAAISLLVIGAIVAPLVRPRRADGEDYAPESAARRERDALYAALHDLEHDHETEKVDDEDYAVLREELRTRAVDLLRAEKEQRAQAPEAPAPRERGPESACPSCGEPVGSQHRFCALCGAALSAPPESEASA